ncbi:TRAP transporter small permease [Bradyrhizobium sp. GCM10027634]|uniref:TRAP transporter small permease n=1 Tax=unclassified Bradyrhizobium TaxID=2631580 RepID=UPI00188D8F3E|nr:MULTISPECIES: TRAP transporter small permease [unclassified Bradyrhizobium]MDN5002186.1 TRAP transporter small permease [Bradyrhizobium sp. WYCCWR 12677]QOZ45565.1 TRAP transporter small permease [Bradyrhizobium sp. CCBAU 53340]
MAGHSDDVKAVGPIRRALDLLYLASGIAAGVFLVAIFAIMMVMSIGRQFALNIPAGDDFASWCMAAMAFLGLAHTFKRGEMIRVGLLLERLHGRTKQVAEIMALGIATAFVLYFTRHALQMTYDSWRFNDVAQGVVALPLWIPQLGFAGGLVILSIALIDEMVNVVSGNQPTYERGSPDETPEEFVERISQGGGG